MLGFAPLLPHVDRNKRCCAQSNPAALISSHVQVAMATPSGLVVPVVRDVQGLSVAQIAQVRKQTGAGGPNEYDSTRVSKMSATHDSQLCDISISCAGDYSQALQVAAPLTLLHQPAAHLRLQSQEGVSVAPVLAGACVSLFKQLFWCL
jgi:hypothetical protein